MDDFISTSLNYISVWGYPAITLALLLANIGVPLPSEITLGFAGFLVSCGRLNFAPVIIAGIAGELLGACLAYGIGYYGGLSLIENYGRMFGLTVGKMERTRVWFSKYGAATLYFGRLLPVVRGVISIPAGFIRLDFWTFFLYTGFSSATWVVLLVYMGQLLGENWRQVDAIGYGLGKAIIILALIGLLAFLYRKKKSRRFHN